MKLRKIRILGLRVVFIPTIFVLLFIAPTWPEGSPVEVAMELSGYILIMLGMGIRIWSSLYIGARKSKQLVTEGPYSLCRNPLYMGTFAIVVGAGLSLINIPIVVFMLLGYIPVHILVARAEERHLAEIFGQEYQDYRRSTPAFIPALRNYHSPEQVLVSARAIRRVAMDASLVLMIPLVGELVELLRNLNLMPVLWRFP